jgi:hypothetical protein
LEDPETGGQIDPRNTEMKTLCTGVESSKPGFSGLNRIKTWNKNFSPEWNMTIWQFLAEIFIQDSLTKKSTFDPGNGL